MAAHPFVFSSSEVATGTGTKTLAHIRAASNHGIVIGMASVSFKGVSATDLPILVQLVHQTNDGTKSDLSPVELDANHPDTLQCTGHENFSGEPTTTKVLDSKYVHPQGSHTFLIPAVADGGKAIGIRTVNTGGTSVNAVVSMRGEE